MRRGFPFRRFPPRVHDRPPELVESEPESEPDSKTFYPNSRDVLEVRGILRLRTVPEGLPVEIVDMIIDAMEYWPSVETRLMERTTIGKDGDRELLRTPGLCFEILEDSSSSKLLPHRGLHPCRKIVFSISSHDQGFGGGGRNPTPEYRGSYSWFNAFIVPSNHRELTSGHDSDSRTAEQEPPVEAQIEPGQPYFLPTANKLQSNLVATSKTHRYEIIWDYRDSIRADSSEAEDIEASQGRGRATLDGRAVRDMKVGDSVSVWARARFPYWSNNVEKLSVRIFWAI